MSVENHEMNNLSFRGGSPSNDDDSGRSRFKPRSPQGGLTRLFHYMTGTPRNRFRFSYLGGLFLLWVLVGMLFERAYVSFTVSRCQWSNWEKWGPNAKPHHVAIVADPQLVDDHTYPGRPAPLMRLTEFVVDQYLRRNWVYIQKNLQPDTTVFLGDLFDGGRGWKDPEWYAELDRWNRIFSLTPRQDVVWSLPGNHDIGYGNEIVPHALKRFEKHFGPLSREFDRGNHTFVQIDTISMENKNDTRINEPPKEFVLEYSQGVHPNPAIVLTHVPFYRRDEDSDCGRQREHGKKLSYTVGHQYQTQLDPDVTKGLLTAINPVLVYSGDDHDACHVTHPFTLDGKNKIAHEYTVKSISMAMGIKKPGIQLLSLYNPNPEDPSAKTYETTICLMPSPFVPFIAYAFTGIGTLVFLLFVHYFPTNLRFLTSKFKYQPLEDQQPVLPVSSKPAAFIRFGRHTIKALFKDIGIVFAGMVIIFWYFFTAIYWN